MSPDYDTAHVRYMGRHNEADSVNIPPAPYYNHPQYHNPSRNSWTYINSGAV